MEFVKRQADGKTNTNTSNSASSIVSTLVPVLIVAVISVIAFLFLRKKFAKIYSPRSEGGIIHEESRRTPTGSKGFFGTLFDVKGLPDTIVLERNSIDGYLFLRFFKILIFLSFAGCLITWPVLFPINATGHGGQHQLDLLSWSNVVPGNRYYGHVFCAWVFLGLITVVVARERAVFIGLRQAYFLNAVRAQRLTSRTVLFMNIPKATLSDQGLRAALGPDVLKVWIATDCDKLEDAVKDRNKAALKLEGAGVKLSKQANKARLEAEKKNPGSQTENRDPNHWLPKKRITHRLKPIIGKKVDTLNWTRQEIPRLNGEIQKEQRAHLNESAKFVSAAFVEFSSQGAAQRAFQLAEKSKKKTMEPRYIDVHPDEVIYKNLKTSYAARKVKLIIATTLVTLMVIFWTPIIAFVGALTNINYLTNKVPFLGFINDIPKVILGVVTGLLPTIVLAVCIILVPIICRMLAKLAGEPTLSAVELKTQSWYFIFQVIQVFLMTTFTSGASAVTTQILQDPTTAPTLLAENLPKASNFYISYFLLFGLAQAASQLLNIAALALFIILGKFLDSTPRKMYRRWVNMSGLGWGSEYPKWTNLGVIAIAYSCIAPLVLGFSTIGFLLLYLAFRYKWLFVLGNNIDMKGEAYSKALQQLMTGVYLSAVCLIGLLAIATAKAHEVAGPLALMVVWLVVIFVFHVGSSIALSPLEKALPLDLVSDTPVAYNDAEAKQHHALASQTNGAALEDRNDSHTTRTADPEANKHSNATTGNMLTRRVRPYIDQHFYEPRKNMDFKLPEVWYDRDEAYYNPAITAEPPFIWLAKDPCGVSTMVLRDNEAAGIRTSDDLAWFDEKNKLHWSVENIAKVRSMLDEKSSMQGTQEERAQDAHDERPLEERK